MKFFQFLLTLCCITSITTTAGAVESVVYKMQKAANEFLDSLPPELQDKATYPLDDDEERTNWHFVPKYGNRKGVVLTDLDMTQEIKLAELLAVSLSAKGHDKVNKIMDLESVLYILEGANHRDPELYFTTIFGTPSADGNWGWRYEGHHLSLNFTIANGKLLSITPNFWGANPARVTVGPTTGQRTLKGEEFLARSFVKSLNATQLKKAHVAEEAPQDIYTSADKSVSPLDPPGIRISDLNKKQIFGLTRVIQEYLANMPDDVASNRWEKLSYAGLEKITFAWAGGLELGDAHYYRIQGPTFVIEYDNIQNNNNHIHAVWREFDGDFGRDILREHYAHQH
ncbi:MAG: hypothetical protein CMI18_09555 [Opitutaceae bacterium]|nr:hypothetical protein [Opitutaceae bacterium]|tara:strand:+ start:12298 stop:13320 length:1023 start_codon:yes stop_codon:yes gene_type:complete